MNDDPLGSEPIERDLPAWWLEEAANRSGDLEALRNGLRGMLQSRTGSDSLDDDVFRAALDIYGTEAVLSDFVSEFPTASSSNSPTGGNDSYEDEDEDEDFDDDPYFDIELYDDNEEEEEEEDEDLLREKLADAQEREEALKQKLADAIARIEGLPRILAIMRRRERRLRKEWTDAQVREREFRQEIAALQRSRSPQHVAELEESLRVAATRENELQQQLDEAAVRDREFAFTLKAKDQLGRLLDEADLDRSALRDERDAALARVRELEKQRQTWRQTQSESAADLETALDAAVERCEAFERELAVAGQAEAARIAELEKTLAAAVRHGRGLAQQLARAASASADQIAELSRERANDAERVERLELDIAEALARGRSLEQQIASDTEQRAEIEQGLAAAIAGAEGLQRELNDAVARGDRPQRELDQARAELASPPGGFDVDAATEKRESLEQNLHYLVDVIEHCHRLLQAPASIDADQIGWEERLARKVALRGQQDRGGAELKSAFSNPNRERHEAVESADMLAAQVGVAVDRADEMHEQTRVTINKLTHERDKLQKQLTQARADLAARESETLGGRLRGLLRR